MLGLFDDVWGNKASIVVDHVVDITLPVREHITYAVASRQKYRVPDCSICHWHRRIWPPDFMA